MLLRPWNVGTSVQPDSQAKSERGHLPARHSECPASQSSYFSSTFSFISDTSSFNLSAVNWFSRRSELEPGHGSPGHRVTGSVIMSGSGRVSGQSYLLTDPVSWPGCWQNNRMIHERIVQSRGSLNTRPLNLKHSKRTLIALPLYQFKWQRGVRRCRLQTTLTTPPASHTDFYDRRCCNLKRKSRNTKFWVLFSAVNLVRYIAKRNGCRQSSAKC